MQPAIRVENLAKSYRISHAVERGGYKTLRESLSGLAARAFRKGRHDGSEEEFWALKDVSFDVKSGEVVGIIGRNGAGKSTLLKILSRITKPTSGQVTLCGRVGSLLEVGTGFHPELTGRENIFLNGSILGMRRAQIDRRFDAIVDFSGVEKFLDTPVKRYSSGMYVRLAFAVAAHLEPEILIIDEVLAVGDAGFQRKCFQKMDSIRRSGGTVLVVSHNLSAITSLCTRAINLERGRILSTGRAAEQVNRYLGQLAKRAEEPLLERRDREGDQTVRIVAVDFRDSNGHAIDHAVSGNDLTVVLRCAAASPDVRVDFAALSLWTMDGVKLLHFDNTLTATDIERHGSLREIICTIPRLSLAPGMYVWNAMLSGSGILRDHIHAAATMEVIAESSFQSGRPASSGGGLFLAEHAWCVRTISVGDDTPSQTEY